MEFLELLLAAKSGDKESRDLLIEKNMGLVWSVVRRFSHRGYEPEDLFQIGVIGLMKAIDYFDTSYNVKFSTYAVPMIMGEIRRFIRDDGMIKVSRPLKETAAKAKAVREQLTKKNGDEPTIMQLAGEMGIEPENLVEALESCKDVESIFKTVYQNDGSPVYLIDLLSNNNPDDITDSITLKQMLMQLEPKERRIIYLRYFKDKTQSETAKEIGISQVQISRMEKKIINRIKDNFGA